MSTEFDSTRSASEAPMGDLLEQLLVPEASKGGMSREARTRLRHAALVSDKVTRPTGLADLAEACQDFAAGVGCDYYLFGFFMPSLGEGARFVLNGYPDSWFARYNELGYAAIDPVVTRALSQGTPFEWGDIKVRGQGCDAFFRDAAAHGICSGFSVRATTSMNGQGELSFSSRNPDWVLGDERREIFGDAMLFAATVADSVFQLLERLAGVKQTSTQLSQRQIEVLDLASQGLQTKQIADVLGISTPTAEFHLRKVLAHLNVPNRAAAIAYALQTGILRRTARLIPHTKYVVSKCRERLPRGLRSGKGKS